MNNRLKKLRVKNNFTEEKIANLLGISTKTYLKYESYERSLPLSLLIKIAKIYNTSIDYIVGETDVKNRYK